MHDLVITNGTVVDGTGAAGRQADVAINDGVITTVGDLSGQRAERVVDAEAEEKALAETEKTLAAKNSALMVSAHTVNIYLQMTFTLDY